MTNKNPDEDAENKKYNLQEYYEIGKRMVEEDLKQSFIEQNNDNNQKK